MVYQAFYTKRIGQEVVLDRNISNKIYQLYNMQKVEPKSIKNAIDIFCV
jgi:hypothetical protein